MLAKTDKQLIRQCIRDGYFGLTGIKRKINCFSSVKHSVSDVQRFLIQNNLMNELSNNMVKTNHIKYKYEGLICKLEKADMMLGMLIVFQRRFISEIA